MRAQLIYFLLTSTFTCSVFGKQSTEQQELQNLKFEFNKIQTQLEALKPLQIEFEAISKRILILESQQNSNSSTKSEPIQSEITSSNADDFKNANENDIKLFATIRPTFGYIDESNESQWDIRDALSHAGIKSSVVFNEQWQGILHAEWGIDLSNNGDFGKARQVYTAIDSPYGKVGIGKQRPVQYLFIAEFVDIFNHSNSPFAYDTESIFFVDNLLTYQIKQGDFTWMLAGQFNGAQGDDNSDLINGGVSYDKGNLHAALTYTNSDVYEAEQKLGDNNILAGAFAYSFDNGVYFAAAYQDKKYNRNLSTDRVGHTFDMSLAYPLSEKYKVKLGYFDFNDGHYIEQTQKFNGANLTFEWLPAENLRLHIEYLYRDFDHLADFNSLSIGIRYDYLQVWSY